jgi:hypothetical protein
MSISRSKAVNRESANAGGSGSVAMLLAGRVAATSSMLSVAFAVLLAGSALVNPVPAGAQTIANSSAKIPNFAPDPKVGWISGGTDWIALPVGPHPVTFDKAHPYIANGQGQQPTWRVADLDNPILQPWVVDSLKKVNERALSGKDAFPPQVRCWPLGVPAFELYPAQPVFFIQSPKEVAMIWQADNMVRRIQLTDRHSDNVKPSWFGESIGHYENGDTLVVDTVGLNTRTFVDNYRTPHTDKLHVIERFRLMPDAKALEVTITVDDPGAFTMPWSAMQRYRRVENGPMLEEACAEGNFNYYNFDLEPMPHTDRADF